MGRIVNIDSLSSAAKRKVAKSEKSATVYATPEAQRALEAIDHPDAKKTTVLGGKDKGGNYSLQKTETEKYKRQQQSVEQQQQQSVEQQQQQQQREESFHQGVERQQQHQEFLERTVNKPTQKVASYLTLGFGKSYEERSFIGKTAENLAYFTPLGYPLVGSAVITSTEKARVLGQYSDVWDRKGAETSHAEAKQYAKVAMTDPATVTAVATVVGAGAAVRFAAMKANTPKITAVEVTGPTGQTARAVFKTVEIKPEVKPGRIRTAYENIKGKASTKASEGWTRAKEYVSDKIDDLSRKVDEQAERNYEKQKEAKKEPSREPTIKREPSKDIAKDFKPKKTEPMKVSDIFQKIRIREPGLGKVDILPSRAIMKPGDAGGRSLTTGKYPPTIRKPTFPEKPVDRLPDKPPERPRPPEIIREKTDIREYREFRDEIRDYRRTDTTKWRLVPFGGLDLDFGAGGGLFGTGNMRYGQMGRGRKTSYSPSQVAIAFDIRGQKPTGTAGLELRPITQLNKKVSKMEYKSKKPIEERRQMFDWMERHKTGGTVSGEKLGQYIQEKGYRLKAGQTRGGEHHFGVYTKKGAEIMRAGVTEKKRIRQWFVN